MTMTSIRKRDGRVAPFDEEKIAGAIGKAFDATYKPGYGETAHKLADEVVSILELEGDRQPDVEHIQDLVERVLMDNGYVQTAKAYILYRDQRSKAREMNTRLMKIYEDITFTAARESDLKRETANIDGDTAMGSMLKFGSEGAKQFYDMFVLKPEHARAHRNGDIHIHDMDFLTLTTTCCQIDLDKLFQGGYSTGHGFLREPNDISSYAALACIAIQSNQNDQHGGQAIADFDYGMADGVRKTFVRMYGKIWPGRCCCWRAVRTRRACSKTSSPRWRLRRACAPHWKTTRPMPQRSSPSLRPDSGMRRSSGRPSDLPTTAP